MSFLLWHSRGDARIASPRRVLRAAEVPLLSDALALREALQRLRDEQAHYVAEAAQRAREQGHADGLSAGRREAHEALAETLTQLAQDSATQREALRNEIGALALQVVRKLLGPFAADEVLVALADTAAAELLPTQPLALVVHPDRCDAVRARLAGSEAATLRCEVRGDASLDPDACRLETEHGRVDAALEAQLARLAEAWGISS